MPPVKMDRILRKVAKEPKKQSLTPQEETRINVALPSKLLSRRHLRRTSSLPRDAAMPEHFKTIIVGAGPVGLIVAHALSLAGIDYVCLEKRDQPFEDLGASLVLYPPTMRVLSQLGIYDDILAIGSKIQRQTTMVAGTSDSWDSSGLTEVVTESHGIPLMAFHRAELVKCIFDGLPCHSKSKILTGKAVVDIGSSDTGVIVGCSDGTSYEGSIVIGADGVYSSIRRIMHRLATTRWPSLSWDSATPYKSKYRCLWLTCARMAEPGQIFETQYHNRSVISISGHEREWTFLFEKYTQPQRDKAMSFTDEMGHFADSFAQFPANDKYTVQDMFAQRLTAGMTALDEGILKHWYLDRMVLVGDACHKMTPNAGFGFNNGVQDAVVLCNSLRNMLENTPAAGVDTGIITQVFKKYQLSRQRHVRKDLSYSGHSTRIQAWANWIYYIFARCIRPWKFVQRLLARQISARLRKSSVLDYVSAQEPFSGSLAWCNPLPQNFNKT